MKNALTRPTILAALLLSPLFAGHAQTVIFSDNFSGSTLNQVPTSPTATSTSYEFFSGINGGSATIGPGALHLALPSTTSVLGEVQAAFSSTPVSLANVGDYLNLTVTFVNTANILLAGNANSSLTVGLYNSGGALPNQGIVTLNTGNTTGGSQNWLGYVGRIIQSGTANVITRPAQTPNGTTSQNQDVLFNNASSSQAFNNPTGATVGSKSTTSSPISLTAGSTYTLDYRIMLSAPGTLSISNALYSGGSVNSANTLFNELATTTASTLITSSFDSFAIGWRASLSAAAASSMDITSITISVPEPGTPILIGVAVLGSLALRHRRTQAK